MDLSQLGFYHRHHITDLTEEEYLQVETEVGARLLRSAAQACGWEPGEVEGVLIGASGPIALDYTERIARQACIPESAEGQRPQSLRWLCRRPAPGDEPRPGDEKPGRP